MQAGQDLVPPGSAACLRGDHTDTHGGSSQHRSMGKASGASGALGDSLRVCHDGNVSVHG